MAKDRHLKNSNPDHILRAIILSSTHVSQLVSSHEVSQPKFRMYFILSLSSTCLFNHTLTLYLKTGHGVFSHFFFFKTHCS